MRDEKASLALPEPAVLSSAKKRAPFTSESPLTRCHEVQNGKITSDVERGQQGESLILSPSFSLS